MPEMHFRVRWPDGRLEECYSPSTIVTEHFEPGVAYSLDDFLARARTALKAANERVRARFGMGCAQAVNQLLAIETSAAAFADTPDATVRIEGFDR
jgi:uncharacterized repeat protein (TIGR04042 family)